MSHNYHPRQGELLDLDARSPVFFDGCPDCEGKAKDPLMWSAEVALAIWQKMVQVEYDEPGVCQYRSNAEAVAGREAYHMSVWLERHLGFDARAARALIAARTL